MKLTRILYYLKDLHRVGALGDNDRKALGAAIKLLERNPELPGSNVAYVGIDEHSCVYWEQDESVFYYKPDTCILEYKSMPKGAPKAPTRDFLLGVDFALSNLVDIDCINSYFIPALKPGKRVVIADDTY